MLRAIEFKDKRFMVENNRYQWAENYVGIGTGNYI